MSMMGGTGTTHLGFFWGAVALAGAAALSACSEHAVGADDRTGQLRALIATADATDDVASVDFKVVAATDDCSGPAIAEATVSLETESFPAGGGMHPFSDHLFVLAPGTYRVCAAPLQADGSPSASCSVADGLATVMAGATTETTLVSQCVGPANGAVDVTVTFNHPPLIGDLIISPSKFILVCETATLTVSASDSDGDTLTTTWSIVSAPAGSTGAALAPSGTTAVFTPDVAGDYTLMVQVADGLGGSASLTFPIHVTAGTCAAPDAPVAADAPPPPPPDAPVAVDAPPPPPPDAGGGLDISGTFASHVTTSGTITVPLIGSQPATIDIVLRIFVQQSGGTLSNHLELCRLNTQTSGGSLVVNFPASVLSLLVDDETVPAPNLTIGGPVPLPTFDVRTGEDAAGMPVDSDGDGNPGVTVPTTLLGNTIQSFVGLDLTLSFPSATLTDANTITGDSAFTTMGTVFDTNPLHLMGPINVTPSSPTTPFVSTRLPGDVPCSQVLTMF